MRIAFLNTWWPGRMAGSGTAAGIAGLASGLRRLGHEVTELTGGASSGSLLARLAANLRLRRQLAEGDFRLAVGFDFDGLLCRPRPASRFVVCLKGIAADERRFERGLPRLQLGCQALLEGANARRAARVVVTSDYCQLMAVETYGLDPGRLRVVPEGIDLAEWNGSRRPVGGAGEVRAPTARGAGAPVVLNVARQYPRKDTRSLLAAVPRLRARHPDLTVRVVGGGPELPRLAALVERLGIGAGVRLLGPLPTDEAVRQEYRDATLFCLASRQEGFGIVLLEAMAAGLPIVACRSGAVPEVVTDGETALLVPPRDPEALAEALLALLADPDRRRRMAEAGRERARRHDWPRVAAEFLERVT